MNNHTAKHFILQLGSLVSLYLSLAFFLVLTFGFINLGFPDGLESVWELEQAAQSIRIGFAMVVVFFPTYIALTRIVNKNRRHSSDSSYLGLTKWLIYLSLLIGGFVLLGDLVAVIIGFLEGELTVRFLLKTATILLVTGAACLYYLKDAQSYWLQRERQSIIYAAAASILIGSTLVSAILYIPSPTEVRELKADNQTISDLQDIQWRIEDYYRSQASLPETLDDLYSGVSKPVAPESRAPYTYKIVDETEYKLCATFKYSNNQFSRQQRPDMLVNLTINTKTLNSLWDYQAGEWCFDRVIDEEYQQ